jgi:glycine/D-amino acid oxidase-like deaminating enzyme
MADRIDILILGGGPIGAAAAYFLSRGQHGKSVALISKDPKDDNAAWQNAGGSIRWFWDDNQKRSMTQQTADFVKNLAAAGTDLSLLEDNYLFLHRGIFVPSINISGAKLVDYFLSEAAAKDVTIHRSHDVIKVEPMNGGGYLVSTSQGDFEAAKVLAAMGVDNAQLIPDYEVVCA